MNCFRALEFWCSVADRGSIDALKALLIDCLGPPVNRQGGIVARFGEPTRI